MAENPNRLLTPKDVADLVGVSPATIVSWADKGLLRCVVLPSGHRRFRRDDVDAFLATTEPAA